MRRAYALVIGVVGAVGLSPAAPAQDLKFVEVTALRRPSAEVLASRALVAEARRAAAGTGSRLAEPPTISALAGPRRGDGESGADFGIGIDVPLLRGRGERSALASGLETDAALLLAGADRLAEADLASAWVNLWLAQTSVELREQALATADAWLDTARRRVEAGADPPYEPTLVAGERDRARSELVAARRDLELAWGELAARADVGPTPRRVVLDGLPDPAVPLADAGTDDLPWLAAQQRISVALARARGGGARSRWALQGELASENEERLAHVGIAYRWPLRGEKSALEQVLATAVEQAGEEARRRAAGLRARLAAARSDLAASPPALGDEDLTRAEEALAVRLAEGKERASQILPLRRQILEARLAALAAHATRLRAAADLHFLSGGPADVR